MTTIQQIKKDKLFAMRGGNTAKVSTLNLLIAELEKEMKLTGASDLKEDQVITVINRQIKKLDKEIEAYVAVNRTTEKQEAEKELLLAYLPKQLNDEELVAFVTEIAMRTKESGGNIGMAMKNLSAKLKGRADMGKVSKLAKELF